MLAQIQPQLPNKKYSPAEVENNSVTEEEVVALEKLQPSQVALASPAFYTKIWQAYIEQA